MVRDKLFETVLLDPLRKGANELFVVSGFTSGEFTKVFFLKDIFPRSKNIKINLIHGMYKKKQDSFDIFQKLVKFYPSNFIGYYIKRQHPEIHCKLYAWFKDGKPICGFSGSANFSARAFDPSKQINQMITDNPIEIKKYFQDLIPQTGLIHKYTFPSPKKSATSVLKLPSGSLLPGDVDWLIPNKKVKISFLSKKFNGVAPHSGLNWGASIRRRHFRNPDQVEVRIFAKAANVKGFFPPKKVRFSLSTDDGHVMDFSIQQMGDKAMASLPNNIFGEYFRKRIGVRSGYIIKTEDLIDYGRTDFTLEKLGEKNFLFDFSKPI